MVRHVILWKLKEMPDAEKAAVKAGIKEGLEGLAGKIPGLLDVRVYTDALPDMDTEMRRLANGTIAKLEHMTDADFDGQRFDFAGE
jgi:hypothetical protein